MAKEYDIYLPTTDNEGTPIETKKIRRVGAKLLTFSTFFPQENNGWWTMHGITYRDSIVIYRVVSRNARTARKFLTDLKEELKKEFRQEEILIVERDVKTL